MPDQRRLPPGRSGRLWLLHRRQTACRALDLLDRKLRILRTEQERFQLMAQTSQQRWVQAVSAADLWGIRAAMLTGREGFHGAASRSPARVDIAWTSVMGVTYPSQVECALPVAVPGTRSPVSAALDRAVTAYGEALVAACEYAVATSAGQIVDDEVQAVRLRRNAIHDRWLPRLGRSLHDLEARLEETERAETVRRRQLADDESEVTH